MTAERPAAWVLPEAVVPCPAHALLGTGAATLGLLSVCDDEHY